MGISQTVVSLDAKLVELLSEAPASFEAALDRSKLPGSGSESQWDAASWLLSGVTLDDDDDAPTHPPPPEAFLVAGGEWVSIEGFGYSDGGRLFRPEAVVAIAQRLEAIEPELEKRFVPEALAKAEPYRYDRVADVLEDRELLLSTARRAIAHAKNAAEAGHSLFVYEW